MKRRVFICSGLALLNMQTALAAQSDVVFHFYGAEDCPPCMAFKRKHLADVQAQGDRFGFRVKENVIRKTVDVPSIGSFGDRDAILRKAASDLAYVYPPIFFVSKDGSVTSVHDHDWQAALKAAKGLSILQ